MSNLFSILKKFQLPNPKSVIQVGASAGQELEDFIANGIVDALLIEPLDLPFSVLKARVSNLKNYVPLQALIHSINGHKVDFHVANNGGMSSSMLPPSKHLVTYPSVEFTEKISLIGYRLDSVIQLFSNEKKILLNQYDMLYLDVQGAELIVLKSAGELLEKIKYIWTEIGVGDGYSGGASYMQIINFLEAYNFQLVYLECELGAFGDALFVKKSENIK